MAEQIDVLCVDDDQEFAALTADYLVRADSQLAVSKYTSPRNALDALETTQFDCIVSDYEMPELTGLEFLDAVRDAHPEIPFILFTGKGSEEIASEAITAGVTDYLQKNPGAEQYELLANRVRNAVERSRAEGRAATHARVNTIVNEVNQALVRARTRSEVEERVCEIISTSDPYAFAWIGALDEDTGEITPRTAAGADDGYLEEVTITADGDPMSHGPAGTAHRTGETQVTQDATDDPAFEPWREYALERGFRSVATVPLIHEDTTFGLLSVYATHAHAFDDAEIALLEELAGDIAHALQAIDVRERLERHQAIIQASGDPVFTVNTNGEFTFVNAAFEELTGYTAEELVDEPVSRLVDDDQLAHIDDQYRSLIGNTDREQARFEVPITTADGGRVPCEIHIATLPDGAGFRGVTGIARDITDQKSREAELADQAEKIERIHQVATTLDEYNDPDAVFERIVEAAEDILEFDLCVADSIETNELVTIAVSSNVPQEGYYERTPIDTEDNLAAQAYRTGEPSIVDDVLEEAVDPATDEYRSVLTVPIGEYGVFQAVTSDVASFDETDLELTELLVAHATQDLQQIEREETLEGVHTAARALMDADTPNGVCERAVSTLEYVFGQSITGIWLYDEAEGRLEPVAWTAEALDAFDDIPAFTLEDSVSGRAFVTGETRVVESMQDEPDAYNPGTDVRSELVLPLGDLGVMNIGKLEPGGFSEWEESLARTFATNTQTALKRAEYTQELESRRGELERQNERLEKFAHLVSHDIRNPLATANGRVELAAAESDDDTVIEHLEKTRDAIDRMDRLIEDVLRLAHEGQTIHEPEALSLTDVIYDSWGPVSFAGATLRVDDDLGTIEGDPERLKAVFENLFRNAIEHGGESVTIEIGRLDEGFYVEDDGSGFPEVDLEKLFDLGYSTSTDGTGFGLAIIEEIADAHDWTITAMNSEDGGARFEFTDVPSLDGL